MAQHDAVHLLSDLSREMPQLVGVKTGVEGLDDLFYVTEFTGTEAKIRPLQGYPHRAVLNITGTPDTGKSLMAEQFTVKQASLGYPVCFVTTEQPAEFLAVSLRQRALAMGLNYDEVQKQIVVVDAASSAALREDMPTLLDTLASVIRQYGVKSTVVDSVTGLFEAREMLARQVVRQLYNFLKKWHQTALLISQKRSGHEELTSEAAGGYAVGHIVDGSLVVSKREIMRTAEQNLYRKPIGETVRLFRIDGCRMSGHDTSVHLLEITPEGLVKIGPRLQDLISGKV